MKYCFSIAALAVLFVVAGMAGTASAHVTVKPAEVKPESYQTFTLSVPVERDVPTTAVRLVVPEGLTSVRPNVKPGWKVNLTKVGSGEEQRITEITWTGGSIPVDFREEFYFSAKTPVAPATVAWKAYQTYSDGVVAAWDQVPAGEHGHDHENPAGPYSQTLIVNAHESHSSGKVPAVAVVLALAACVLAGANTVYLLKKP